MCAKFCCGMERIESADANLDVRNNIHNDVELRQSAWKNILARDDMEQQKG
jgi:hypothetical protein